MGGWVGKGFFLTRLRISWFFSLSLICAWILAVTAEGSAIDSLARTWVGG